MDIEISGAASATSLYILNGIDINSLNDLDKMLVEAFKTKLEENIMMCRAIINLRKKFPAAALQVELELSDGKTA